MATVYENSDKLNIRIEDLSRLEEVKNEEWRNKFVTLEMKFEQKYEQGYEEGIAEGIA